MIKALCTIPNELSEEIELGLYEISPHNWSIDFNLLTKQTTLIGYYKSKADANKSLEDLFLVIENKNIISLEFEKIKQEDWKNSYKKHFHPWNFLNFHWIPIWCKDSYIIPKNHKKVYLDPGMAFGTGTHETTKLCLEAMVEIEPKLTKMQKLGFLDIGCGSGILSITASVLGFNQICAIDSDQDAIRVSKENSALNKIYDIKYIKSGIENFVLASKKYFIIANIQADILKENAARIIQKISPESYLLLSGILKKESCEVAEFYEFLFQEQGYSVQSEIKYENDWSLIQFIIRD